MIPEKDLRACAKEFNLIMGLDPPINTNKDLESLVEEIQQGIELIKSDDVFSDSAMNVINAFKSSTENNPVTVIPEEKPPVTTSDLSQLVRETHNLEAMKEIIIQNIEFKALRDDMDSFIQIDDLRDKMFEILATMRLKGKEPAQKKPIKVRPIEDETPPVEDELPVIGDEIADLDDEIPAELPFDSDLQINDRFRIACPFLSEDEFKALEELILRDGVILQPIITWQGFIVDGHNRYDIAMKHGITYTTQEKEFDSEEDVIVWIKENAISQRNLSDFAKIELIGEIEDVLKATGKKKMALKSLSPMKEHHDTWKEMSKKTGVSQGQISKAKLIEEKADEQTKEKLRKGELKIGTVHKELSEKKERKFSFRRAAGNLEKWVKKYSGEERLEEFISQVSDIVKEIRKMK